MPFKTDLPGYKYDTEHGRYIDRRNGKPVSMNSLQSLLDEHGEDDEKYLIMLLLLLADGELAPSIFVDLAAETLRNQHMQHTALGSGGWLGVTGVEADRIEREIQIDMVGLTNLAAGVVAGSVSIPVARERLRGYIGNARAQFYRAEKERIFRPLATMIIIERRQLGASKHCKDCLDYYYQGWQLQGILPPPGVDSVCGTHCRCRLIRRIVPAVMAPLWLDSRKSTL